MHSGLASVLALGLALGCERAGEGAAQSQPEPSAEAVDAGSPNGSLTPGEGAKLDAVAHGLSIERLTEGVYWIDEATLREVMFAIATEAWRLEPAADGVTLRVNSATVLADRLGARDGDVVLSFGELAPPSPSSGRDALDAIVSGERVPISLRRGTTVVRMFVRRPSPGAAPRQRLEDIMAAALYDEPEAAIDRAVLVAFGEQASRLEHKASELLGLLRLPEDAKEIAIDGQSIAPTDLARKLGDRAAAERVEIVADQARVQYRIVSGTVQASDIAPHLGHSAASRELLDASRLPRGVPTDTEAEDVSIEGVERVDELHYRISRTVIEAWLGDPATLAKMARIVPAMRDGNVRGFRLYAIRRARPEAPTLAALGFKNGDTVLEVNGRVLDSAEAAMELYTKVRKATAFEVLIDRKGEEKTLRIEVTSP